MLIVGNFTPTTLEDCSVFVIKRLLTTLSLIFERNSLEFKILRRGGNSETKLANLCHLIVFTAIRNFTSFLYSAHFLSINISLAPSRRLMIKICSLTVQQLKKSS